jgi:hypothetical protein
MPNDERTEPWKDIIILPFYVLAVLLFVMLPFLKMGAMCISYIKDKLRHKKDTPDNN